MNWPLILLSILVLVAIGIWLIVKLLPGKAKGRLSNVGNDALWWSEKRGLFKKNVPTFRTDFQSDYPELKQLDRHFSDIQHECLRLLVIKEHLIDAGALGGQYTRGGIYTADWKTFVLKWGNRFVDENCDLCPKTHEHLTAVPGIFNAFFSVLDANQYIKPHQGYYKGFIRYHLGVVIPSDNKDNTCHIRINDDIADNKAARNSNYADNKVRLDEGGAVYYWKNGESVLFDDTFLHDATNDSDEVRVVLYMDIVRKMPFYMHWISTIVLWFVFQEPSIKSVRKNAVVARRVPRNDSST